MWLGWRGVCCVTWFSPMCRALPQGLQLAQLCFPGDVGWASTLPFFFCVRVLQLRWCLLGLTVRSPCCLSLTLGWVCFWPTVSQAFVGCEGGLSCPSWFVILFLCRLSFTFSGVGVAWSQVCGPSCNSWVLDSSDARLRRPDALSSGRTLSCCRLGFAWRLWPLGGPGTCCFLEPYLGFFPLASSVGRWLEVVEVYPWWSSLRSFAVEGVALVLCQVLVGLPS